MLSAALAVAGMVEIIEWADLIGDARLRNQAFIHAAGLRFDWHCKPRMPGVPAYRAA